jgi:cobalt/nickel transport system permease protein
MHLEEFATGHSIWHRMDPRVKLVGAGAFALVTAVCDHLPALLLALALSTLAVAAARLDLRQVAIRMGAVNGFVLLLWLFLPFTTPGEVLWRWGWLALHREGLLLALAITLKANAIAGTTIALLGTSPVFSLVHALIHLKAPQKLVQLFFFCFRYVSVIHGEYLRLRTSMRIRCFRPRTDLHTYRSFAYLLGMLFVRSFDRSQRIYQAMVLRGFTGTFWTLDHFRMRRADWCALIGMAACVGVVVFLQTTESWT